MATPSPVAANAERASPAPSAPVNVHSPASVAISTGDLARVTGGELVGPADIVLTDVRGVADAGEQSLTFIRSAKFAAAWASSKAAAALVTRGIQVADHDPATRALIYVDDADLALIPLLARLSPPIHEPEPGVHPSAVVHPSARLGAGVKVGAFCVVGPGAKLGDGVVLHPRVSLGANVTIGPATVLHPGVVVYDRCEIGAKCVLHANVVIGADGFGFHPDPQGRGAIKIPHIGNVRLGNAVEIGACSCVDCGKFGSTLVGDGTKIDNHVQIGHNVRIGRGCLICGVVGIGGSAILGDGVIVGGHSGIADGMTLGDRVRIGAKSGVMCNVPAGATYTGYPAKPHQVQMRAWSALYRLSDVMRQLRNSGLIREEPSSRGF